MSVRSFFGRSIASLVREINLAFTDITTANSTTSQHGLLPKLSGSTTTFLRGDGVFSSVGGGAGGALTLLEEHTASNSATLDFTSFISSAYDDYLFEFINILPVTDGVDFWMRSGTGAGPTWDTGTNYSSRVWAFAGGTAVETNLGSTKNFISRVGVVGNDSRWGYVGFLKAFNLNSSSVRKMHTGEVFFEQNAAGGFETELVSGAYDSLTVETGKRFLMSSGNIASGTIRAYGFAL